LHSPRENPQYNVLPTALSRQSTNLLHGAVVRLRVDSNCSSILAVCRWEHCGRTAVHRRRSDDDDNATPTRRHTLLESAAVRPLNTPGEARWG